jgi:hypothetical protein
MDFFVVYVYKVLCGQPEPNTKEMQTMTDERVSACVNFAKKSSPHLLTLHHCTKVIQINSVPLLSHCCSTGKRLNEDGVQLIMGDSHVCLHRDIAAKWFHYYRLRHFPKFMCGLILEWIKDQPWYFENKVFDVYRLLNSHWVDTYKRMYAESLQILMT